LRKGRQVVINSSFRSIRRCMGRNFCHLWSFLRSDHLKPRSTKIRIAAMGNVFGLVLASYLRG
jgi:hypothetical protein